MDTREVIAHIQGIEIENSRLREEVDRLKQRRLDAGRFYAVAVNVNTVATLHNVHPDTIRKYIDAGLIEKHPDSMDAKILIRASDALLLNFSELRQRYRMRLAR